MSTQEEPRQSTPAAEIPQPAPTIAPEAVIDRLRDLRSQIGEVNELTPEQRRALASRLRTPGHIVQASIDVMGALTTVSQAVGQPPGEVRQLVDEASRWTSVENELRAMLNGVAGANLLRRQRIEFVTRQAVVIGSRLALDPAHKVLVPHVQEVKRLKRISRRKKPATAPEAPQSPTPAPPAPGGSGGAKS